MIRLMYVLFIVCIPLRSGAEQVVEITINNPYSATLSSEVKCDWNNVKKDFDFYKKIYVQGKSSVKIGIPNRFKQCQVWPKIESWF